MKNVIADLIGKHVFARRMELGLSQEEVAHLVGISRQALSAIERGVNPPHWPTLYGVAGVLHCDVFDLLPSYNQVKRLHEAAQESL